MWTKNEFLFIQLNTGKRQTQYLANLLSMLFSAAQTDAKMELLSMILGTYEFCRIAVLLTVHWQSVVSFIGEEESWLVGTTGNLLSY